VHDRLPAKAAAAAGARRHVVVLLGDCGVGKTKLIETLCAGPPDPGVLEGLEAPTAGAPSGGGGAGGGDGGGDGGGGTRREQRTWPTVAPKCYHTEVTLTLGPTLTLTVAPKCLPHRGRHLTLAPTLSLALLRTLILTRTRTLTLTPTEP
jgi:hypothetical protein